MLINTAKANSDIITLQDSVSTPEAPNAIEIGWLANLAPMILILVVFYFLLFRPQEKQRRRQEELIGSVKRGEEVLTNSGMFGVVTKINDSDNTIYIQIAKDLEIKVLKNSIIDIVSRSQDKLKNSATKPDNKNKK